MIIPMLNRMVEEVVSVIRSLLGCNEIFTGMRHQLIVHASPQKIREIKSLLGKIDDQLKNLRITVKQGLKSQLSLRQEEMRVEVPIGDSCREIVNRGRKDSVVLESKPGKEVVRRKLSKRKSIQDEMNTQIVTTLKGNTATIFIGQQVPFTTTENFRT